MILYEMTLSYLGECEEALAAGSERVFKEAVRKVRACLNELLNSLHMEYEPARQLLQLYLFCIRRLAQAEVKKDSAVIDEIRRVLRPLCDAYKQIAEQNEQGPVMGNSQTVYAGLTYGRKTLTENMADQGSNRGMLV